MKVTGESIPFCIGTDDHLKQPDHGFKLILAVHVNDDVLIGCGHDGVEGVHTHMGRLWPDPLA